MAPFQDTIVGLQATTKVDALAKADSSQAMPAALAYSQAKALVGAALAEKTNTPAIEQALQGKLAEVETRLAALTEQVGPERLQSALAPGGDTGPAPAAPPPPPAPTPAAAPPPAPTPAAAPLPPPPTAAGPAKDYFKESFKLLKVAMAADAKGKRGDAAQQLEAAVQFSLTLDMLDLALAPGNCAPNIQEKLRVKREEVVGKRSALVGVVGAERLEAALQEAKAGAGAEPPTVAAAAQSQVAPGPPSPSRVPAPEPEPQPMQMQMMMRPADEASAYPATPASLLASPFAWRAPPAGRSEGGGAEMTPASVMYGGLSPISAVDTRPQTAADALAKMERTLAESSRALASVREYSAKTMAEVDSRSRRPFAAAAGRGGGGVSPSSPTTPLAADRSLAADHAGSPAALHADGGDVDISARLQALHAERARRERAEAQLREEAERRAEAEHSAKVAGEELQRLETALAAAERKVATCNTELERRESQLAEQAKMLEKTQTDSSQAVKAAEERARGMTHERLERASEKARAYADEAVQRSSARVEAERKLKEEAQRRAQEEADRRQAAERQAEEAAASLSKVEQIQAAAEKKAHHTAEVLARRERELAEAKEALHRANEEAERLVSEAQARARDEAESRGKAAAEAAMQVAEEAAERASERVTTEIILRDEALARSRAEVAKREAAERRNHELSDNLLRLEVMHEEAQEALVRSQNEADAAAELADSLRQQAEHERLSHQEEARGVAEARRAAELRAEETAMALAKAQQMLNAQAEALARVRADADRLVTDATAKAADKVTSVVNLKKQATREADTRLRREVAARARLERQQGETVEALAKTEAMLAASTEALEQARKEAAALRFQEMPGSVHGAHVSAFAVGQGLGFDTETAAIGMPEGNPTVPFAPRALDGGVLVDDGAPPKALQRLKERQARRSTRGPIPNAAGATTGAGGSAHRPQQQQRQRRRPRAAERTGSTQLSEAERNEDEQELRGHLRSRGLERCFSKLSAFVRTTSELMELTEEDATEIGLSAGEFRSLCGPRGLEL
jgi:hypothetical protein